MAPNMRVSLVADLDELIDELTPQPMWMVRPQHLRKYETQRMTMIAEVVDLNTLDLQVMSTGEMV